MSYLTTLLNEALVVNNSRDRDLDVCDLGVRNLEGLEIWW